MNTSNKLEDPTKFVDKQDFTDKYECEICNSQKECSCNDEDNE